MDSRQCNTAGITTGETPGISVVLVNYNGQKHLEYCLPALFRTETVSFEVIVVDNNSTDGSKQWLREKYPQVCLIELDDNTGFGYANSRGIERAQSEFVALLNTDTEVTPSWLSTLFTSLKDEDDVAAVCSELRLRTQPRILNAQGGGMTWVGVGFDHRLGYPVSTQAETDCRETLFPTAAAMLMRRSAFDKIGGFDPEFFMYHEDVDLGWRFWIGGYRVLLCPSSVVYHQYGGTTRSHQSNDFAFRLGLRHCLRALLKNYSLPYALVVVPSFLATLVLKGQTHKLPSILMWNLKRWRNTMTARSVVQNSRETSDGDLFRKRLIGFPFPFPRQPLTVRPGCYMPVVKELIVNYLLDLTKGSSDGRLGMGWSARGENRNSRCVVDQAVCTLRVEAQCRGSLEVTLHRSDDCEGIFLAINAENEIELESSGGWDTCHLPGVVSDVDGGLVLAFRSVGEGCPGIQSIQFVPEQADADGKSFSVVIPTYNRLDCLRDVLMALESQTLLPIEVIVVDDGSERDTAEFLDAWAGGVGNFTRRACRQENRGPATARNRGVAEASGDYVVFIGDDTIPDSAFLFVHHEAHCEQGPGNAIVGYTDWDRETIRVTPFMDFINNYGYQFGYALILAKSEASYHFFYTSNISVGRQTLLAFPFDETFEHAGWEDTELGHRLGVAGQRIVYYPEARTAHRHVHSVETFTGRQALVGKLSTRFADKCPELSAAMVPVMSIGNRLSLAMGWVFECLRPIVHKWDQQGHKLPHLFWRHYLHHFLIKGFVRESRKIR